MKTLLFEGSTATLHSLSVSEHQNNTQLLKVTEGNESDKDPKDSILEFDSLSNIDCLRHHTSPPEFKTHANDIHLLDYQNQCFQEGRTFLEPQERMRIIESIVSRLDEECRNGLVPSTVDRLSGGDFHCYSTPTLSLMDYCKRIYTYSGCELETLVVSFILVNRVIRKNPTFHLSIHNCHKLFLTAILVSSKLYEDDALDNVEFAKVGGVEVEELNSMEGALLQLLGYELYIDEQEYFSILRSLCV
jgi:hypothetical protein